MLSVSNVWVMHGSVRQQEVFGTGFAFAALKKDGCVVTWGEAWIDGYRRRELRCVMTPFFLP